MKIPNRWLQLAWMFLASGALLVGLVFLSEDSYLLFHTLIELFSIIVAGSAFMVAWNARRYLDNHYFLFIGIAYFFTIIIDLLHTMAYHGMGVFADTGSNLATQLWIAGRYLQSISLLLAPFFCRRKVRVYPLILVYSLVTGLLLASIFYWGNFPISYIESSGLTVFKIASEYIVIILLVGAILALFTQRQEFDQGVFNLLVGSILAAIVAEVAFTAYVNVYSGVSAFGHFLRLVSFYLVYKAIVETGLIRPQSILYRNLAESEERLRQQARELQIRNDELDAFAHTVAHDLKNPLATLIVAVDVLSGTDVRPEELPEFLQDLKSTAYRMNRIIDNLLLLAQVRKSDMPLELFEMAEVIANVRKRLGPMISETQARIEVADHWPPALGYAPWIEEVLANYISNAIKYGGRPPLIQLGTEELIAGTVCFWVQDNGEGISAEEQALLFKPFSQLHNRRAGHGLGLSIVRQIVEKMGGQVGVESAPGLGSRFYFTLNRFSGDVLENLQEIETEEEETGYQVDPQPVP